MRLSRVIFRASSAVILIIPSLVFSQATKPPTSPRPQFAQPQRLMRGQPQTVQPRKVQQPQKPPVPPEPVRPSPTPPKQPARVGTSGLVQGFSWKRVDVHWNILFQAVDAYSSGLGFAFVPHYRLVSGFAFGLSTGMQLAKLSNESRITLMEAGVFGEIPLDRIFFLKTDAGIVNPVPRDSTMLKPIFPYFGAGLGMRIGGRSDFIRNLTFQYHVLMSEEKAHQILLGVGLGW